MFCYNEQIHLLIMLSLRLAVCHQLERVNLPNDISQMRHIIDICSSALSPNPYQTSIQGSAEVIKTFLSPSFGRLSISSVPTTPTAKRTQVQKQDHE
jgi:hypothetical protein